MGIRIAEADLTVLRSIVLLATILLIAAVGRAEPGKAALTGTVMDPSGLGMPGVKLTIVDSVTHVSIAAVSDASGHYQLSEVPMGTYHLTAVYPGFAQYSREVALGDSESRQMNVMLQLQTPKESVTVWTQAPDFVPLAGTQRRVDDGYRARSGNMAELLGDLPGVGLRQNGEFATIPLLHGLGDERAKLLVNGMTVSASCPNHMNPPLSYIDPTQVAKANVMAGITPVNMGGDSIAGTVSIESPQPVFAGPGEGLHADGIFSTFFRSNGSSYGGSLSSSIAGRNLSFGYSGSWANIDNYSDGSGHEVTSTYAQTTNHTVTLAAQRAGNLFVLQAGLQNTPYQGFPNQQMDMTQNRSQFFNVRYRRDVRWGVLDTRLFWQNVRHEMNIGDDKSTFPYPMWMPMDTHGRDLGYSVKLSIPLSEQHALALGNEFHRFVLDDTWPAVPGQDPWMGPNTFTNINDGHRRRIGWFAELTSKWNSKWTTLLGIRNDIVSMNTGAVSGYSDDMMYAEDAAAFNALSHSRTDINIDVTGLARYEPNRFSTYEIGYARKTRTPNLYERYAWSTNWMASGMINWFGDGNYYVGNLNLRPEVAHTVSATASWHDRERKIWEIKITPYQSYVHDYIGVNTLATTTYGESTFSQLQFANHNATIYGIDLAGTVKAWDSFKFGRGEIRGVAGWIRGKTRDTENGLYQMPPLNARFSLDETLRGWTAGLEIQLVDRKSNIDPLRYEPRTPGYSLLNLHSGYQFRYMRIEVGGDNLLNKYYYLPMGGVNFDDYLASGWSGQIRPLTGAGRSFYAGLTVRF